MVKIVTRYPELEICGIDLGNQMFPVLEGETEGQFLSKITLPPNDTDEDQVYLFELYVDGQASGLITGIIVSCEVIYQTIQIIDFFGDPAELPPEGGEVTIYLNFIIVPETVPPPPSKSLTVTIGNGETKLSW